MRRYVIKRIKDGKYYIGCGKWHKDINRAILAGYPNEELDIDEGEIVVEVEIKEKK